MNRRANRFGAILMTILALGAIVSGCATTAVDEQEGGISGTGNAINCTDEKYRKLKMCNRETVMPQ